MKPRVVCLLWMISVASAAEWGVVAGVPLYGPVVSTNWPPFCCVATPESWTRHPALGFTASSRIAGRVGIRVDATWQRWGVSSTASGLVYQAGPTGPSGILVGKQATTANRWRLPVLAQWAPGRHIRLGVGPELSLITGSRARDVVRNPFTGSQSFAFDAFRSLDRQAVFGAGASTEFPFSLGPLVVAPDVRYTRWTAKHYSANFPKDELVAGISLRLRWGLFGR